MDDFPIQLLIFLIIISIICGIFIGAAISDHFYGSVLGQSICEERYHSDFVKYENGKLYCQSKPIEQEYDGIEVIIKEANEK